MPKGDKYFDTGHIGAGRTRIVFDLTPDPAAEALRAEASRLIRRVMAAASVPPDMVPDVAMSPARAEVRERDLAFETSVRGLRELVEGDGEEIHAYIVRGAKVDAVVRARRPGLAPELHRCCERAFRCCDRAWRPGLGRRRRTKWRNAQHRWEQRANAASDRLEAEERLVERLYGLGPVRA